MAAQPNPADRVISHMNNDHQDALVRYLEHYCGTSSFAARNAYLTELTLTHMVIRTAILPTATSAPPANNRAAKNNRYTIPFDPPLKSWSEVRERVVAMDKRCIAALGRSDITVKEYLPPTGVEAVAFATILLLYASMFRRENFNMGTGSGAWWPWTMVGSYVPGLFQWVYGTQPKIFWGLLGTHCLEALFMDRLKLRKHSVPRGSGLWWKFMLGHVVEGFPSFLRFDKKIKQLRAAKENAKH